MNNTMISIIDGIKTFPIGEISIYRNTLLCKTAIVSYIAKFQDCFAELQQQGISIEELVKNFLSQVISLENHEVIPDLKSAESFLHLDPGFVEDYSNIKWILDRHPEVKKLYELISSQISIHQELGTKKQR